MPLPETLPKASSSRKKTPSARPRKEASVSRYSTGLTTEDEASAFSRLSSVFKSDISSTTGGGNYITEDHYTTDNYTTGDEFDDDDELGDEFCDDQYKNEKYPDSGDDTSSGFFSSMSNSLMSNGTDTTSVSGVSAASGSSNYSQIYEPRLIQKRQASSVRDAEDKRLLPDILEEGSSQESSQGESFADREEENVETVYRKSKGKKKMLWKKLFKRNKSKSEDKNAKTPYVVPVALPSDNKKKTKVQQTRLPAPIMMEERPLVDAEDSIDEILNDKEEADDTLQMHGEEGRPLEQDKSDLGSSLGWLSLSSWLSSEGMEGTHNPTAEVEETRIDDLTTPNELDSTRSVADSADKSLHEDPAADKEGEGTVAASLEETEARPVTESRRKLPTFLPMPMSFMRKRKEIRRQQEEQRRRILSILESEEQNTTNTKSILKQHSETQDESPDSMEKHDEMPEEDTVVDSEAAAADLSPREEKKSMSFFKKRKGSSQEESREEPETREIEEETPNLAPQPQIAHETNVQYMGRVSKQRGSSSKNHLQNIVKGVKAERVVQQASGSFRRKPQTLPQVELPEPAEEEKYLGKKKTAKSIQEEKRMLKEMDTFVKRRLKALEETEEEERDTSNTVGCCSCGLFSS